MNNKRTALVSFSLWCCVLGLSVQFACQKKAEPILLSTAERNSALTTTTHPYFHKGVGAPIDSATANRYKQNLRDYLSKTRATATTTVYYLPAAELQQIISRDSCVGVLFYFGKDSVNNVLLMPIGVDNKNYVMPVTTVVTTAGPVSWKVARQWRGHFQQQYPDGSTPWGYFYGSIAIQRLLDQGTEQVRIELGRNDEGTQQLIYSDASDPAPTYEEDRGTPCPPCATDDDVIN